MIGEYRRRHTRCTHETHFKYCTILANNFFLSVSTYICHFFVHDRPSVRFSTQPCQSFPSVHHVLSHTKKGVACYSASCLYFETFETFELKFQPCAGRCRRRRRRSCTSTTGSLWPCSRTEYSLWPWWRDNIVCGHAGGLIQFVAMSFFFYCIHLYFLKLILDLLGEEIIIMSYWTRQNTQNRNRKFHLIKGVIN